MLTHPMAIFSVQSQQDTFFLPWTGSDGTISRQLRPVPDLPVITDMKASLVVL
jgi:hypothetical protein